MDTVPDGTREQENTVGSKALSTETPSLKDMIKAPVRPQDRKEKRFNYQAAGFIENELETKEEKEKRSSQMVAAAVCF